MTWSLLFPLSNFVSHSWSSLFRHLICREPKTFLSIATTLWLPTWLLFWVAYILPDCTYLLPHSRVFFLPFFRLLKYEKAMSINSLGLEKSTSKCSLFHQIIFCKFLYLHSCWMMWDTLRPTFQQVSFHRLQHLI